MRCVLRTTAALALFVLAFAVPAVQARAAAPLKQPTSLQLDVASMSVALGTHPTVTIRMTAGGSPVGGQLIAVRIDGTISREVTTGKNGMANARISRDLPAGSYTLTATFAGTPTFTSSESQPVILTVKPALLVITTVPPIAGLFLVTIDGGPRLKTAADGSVRFTARKVGQITLRVALPTSGASRRTEFARWGDGVYGLERKIRIPDTTQLSIGLQLSYPVRFEFSGSQDSSIDPAQVPHMTVTDSSGTEVAVTGAGENWLAANRISHAVDGLVSTPLQYRVTEVPLGGANVVNRGQQQFEFEAAASVHINLLVFSLTIQGSDALLGTASGSQARVTPANGTDQVVPLDGQGRAVVPLPRGEYHIALADGLGYAVPTVVSLSRDQAADAKLLSVLDVGLIGAVLVIGAIALLLIGRPSIIRRRRREDEVVD